LSSSLRSLLWPTRLETAGQNVYTCSSLSFYRQCVNNTTNISHRASLFS
jgi:hypothetical protein